MITRQNRSTELRFRKRPEPCRVVPLGSLRKTNSGNVNNEGPLVSHTGSIKMGDSWEPAPRGQINVEVSKSSWEGLHSRFTSSMAIPTEVA